MTRRQRLRRIAILCCHCLRNTAFYRAWHQVGNPQRIEQFWISVNSNFLDIAVLEWCKIFADLHGMHFWRKVISDPDGFWAGLLKELELTETQFGEYVAQMRTYRDQFVAHLDSEEVMHIPHLHTAIASSQYLYDYLLTHEEEDNCFHDAPKDAVAFYKQFQAESAAVYESIKT